jgi:hypothetical protein
MAQETELLYVVTVVIFILICDLIMAWIGSPGGTAILPSS